MADQYDRCAARGSGARGRVVPFLAKDFWPFYLLARALGPAGLSVWQFGKAKLEDVVPEIAWHALPRLEGRDVAAQEVAHAGVELEAQEEPPRVAQHHYEGHQAALRAADPHRAEVGPVDLGLLLRRR